MLTGKKVRFGDSEHADGEHAKLNNFPEWTLENADNFHTVRGRRVCGLLVDPGASSGLVGTDTLKELMESGMIPPDREVKYHGVLQLQSLAFQAKAMTPWQRCPFPLELEKV